MRIDGDAEDRIFLDNKLGGSSALHWTLRRAQTSLGGDSVQYVQQRFIVPGTFHPTGHSGLCGTLNTDKSETVARMVGPLFSGANAA